MPITSPLFKGATRPACIAGVPIRPFIGVAGGSFLLALWTWMPLALLAVPVLALMREATKEDDQKFRAIGIRLRRLGLAPAPVRFSPAKEA